MNGLALIISGCDLGPDTLVARPPLRRGGPSGRPHLVGAALWPFWALFQSARRLAAIGLLPLLAIRRPPVRNSEHDGTGKAEPYRSDQRQAHPLEREMGGRGQAHHRHAGRRAPQPVATGTARG